MVKGIEKLDELVKEEEVERDRNFLKKDKNGCHQSSCWLN